MRVFLHTNVLVSAFATRGLCADVFRHIVSEHSLVTGEVVLKELRRVLRARIRLPVRTVDMIEDLLREYEVVPKPAKAAAWSGQLLVVGLLAYLLHAKAFNTHEGIHRLLVVHRSRWGKSLCDDGGPRRPAARSRR